MDKSQIISVCIDDFALKKGQRYGTVMVDVETHKIVDMIDSRETKEVICWLKEYPNLRVVSRDGSQQYAAAISEAHPGAMQVSDRFHILKNLNERVTEAFQKMFQGRIVIPATSATQNLRYKILMGSKAERIRIVKRLRADGHSKGAIELLTGLSTRMVKKYVDIPENGIPEESRSTSRGRDHEDAVKKVSERANHVKELQKVGLSVQEIAQKSGFTRAMVQLYLSPDFSPVNGHYGKQREGKLALFREDVLRWKMDGLTYREIYEQIKEKGYSGSEAAIRGFVTKERRIRRDLQAPHPCESVEFIDKKWLIRLLYKPLEDVKGISAEQLAAIQQKYPLAERLLNLVNEFKALVKAKNSDSLMTWMERAVSLGTPELDRFVNGLKMDIDAVVNALTTNFSNGLAEGSVNKIKVIKRIMYGRCHFDLLKNKCLLNGSFTG